MTSPRPTAAQSRSFAALVSAKRVERVVADAGRATAFLAAAAERTGQLPLLTSASVKYDVAYDAAHDVGEALLAAYGYRTMSGPGQHEALGRFLRAVFDSPPGERAARRFDRLRRARNQNRYEARPTTAADASEAEQTAAELLEAASALITQSADLSARVRRGAAGIRRP